MLMLAASATQLLQVPQKFFVVSNAGRIANPSKWLEGTRRWTRKRDSDADTQLPAHR